jgi:hypothetical protein
MSSWQLGQEWAAKPAAIRAAFERLQGMCLPVQTVPPANGAYPSRIARGRLDIVTSLIAGSSHRFVRMDNAKISGFTIGGERLRVG